VHVWTQKASASNKTPYPATLLLLPLCSQPAFKGPVAFPATWPCPATGRLTQPAAPLLVSDLHATLISSATFCVRAAQRGALAIGTTHDPRCGNCGLPCSGPRGATRMPLAQRAHPSARASWSPSQTSHCLRAARMRARHQPRAPHRRAQAGRRRPAVRRLDARPRGLWAPARVACGHQATGVATRCHLVARLVWHPMLCGAVGGHQ